MQAASETAAVEMDVQSIKEAMTKAREMTSLSNDLQTLAREIASLEKELSLSGSTKTMAEIQKEHDIIQTKWYLFSGIL